MYVLLLGGIEYAIRDEPPGGGGKVFQGRVKTIKDRCRQSCRVYQKPFRTLVWGNKLIQNLSPYRTWDMRYGTEDLRSSHFTSRRDFGRHQQ